jgi:glycosyltransferase involved in cell wall biosynthesis
MRGGEKVLEAFLEIFPDAEIYTLFHEKGKVSSCIEAHSIRTSWLNRIPGVYRYYREMLPLLPSAVQSLDLRGFDLVISSSHAVAKGARVGEALHVCYCHTPMRYAWDAADDYRPNALRMAALSALRPRLQRWDRQTANQVDHFVANSIFVQNRIRKYYDRDAEVISPPVDTAFFTPSTSIGREQFFVAAGALVPYKRFDIVIQAFNRLGRSLIVIGDGPESRNLRRIAAENIHFAGRVSDQELRRLYQSARALVFAGREDFGMVAVEARACGCPVIAFGMGGSAETVVDGKSGILFAEQNHGDLIRAVSRFETMAWPVEQVRAGVEKFSREVFQRSILQTISHRMAERSARGEGTRAFASQSA